MTLFGDRVHKEWIKLKWDRTSLVVQWLRICDYNPGAGVRFLVRELRSRRTVWHNQKRKWKGKMRSLGRVQKPSGKESTCQGRRCKRHRFDPWVRKITWRRKCQPTPVFLPRELHGWRSLAGYNLWGHEELDTSEQLTLYNTLDAYKLFWFFMALMICISYRIEPPIIFNFLAVNFVVWLESLLTF